MLVTFGKVVKGFSTDCECTCSEIFVIAVTQLSGKHMHGGVRMTVCSRSLFVPPLWGLWRVRKRFLWFCCSTAETLSMCCKPTGLRPPQQPAANSNL